MAGVNTFRAMAIFAAILLLSMIISNVSAQDLPEAPAAAPELDTGSAYACGVSGAISMVCSSLVFAALAV